VIGTCLHKSTSLTVDAGCLGLETGKRQTCRDRLRGAPAV
jgi:hypothetical protein